jgi:hypothetical protein
MVDGFFPLLEQLVSREDIQSSPNYIPLMVLLCKNFYVANHLDVAPYLFAPGKLAPWVGLFNQILQQDLGEGLQTLTESFDAINKLNKQPGWQLKGIVAQISLQLYQKSGNAKTRSNRSKQL